MLFKNKQLQHALKTQNTNLAISCIKAGAICDQKWLTNFLLDAIQVSNITSIQTYVISGLNIEIPITKDSKETMLYYAARTGRTQIVQYLASQHANTNTHSKKGTSALSDTACNDGPNAATIIKILVEYGADIDYQIPKSLETALIKASQHNNPEATRALIDLKADQTITNSSGKTAWELSHSYTAPLFPEFQTQIDKEITQQKQKKDKIIKRQKSGTWSGCFNQSIAHIQTSAEIQRELTEIFNFSSQNVTTIIQNTETKFESHSKEGFSEYTNKDQLRTACIEYNKLPNIETIDPDEIIHIQTKIIDGKKTNKSPLSINK